mgnify:CR=1 FL=1
MSACEIKISCKGDNFDGVIDCDVEFFVWHEDAGMALCVSRDGDTDEEKKSKYVMIPKEVAITLAQQILQMYQISFTPNALCK